MSCCGKDKNLNPCNKSIIITTFVLVVKIVVILKIIILVKNLLIIIMQKKNEVLKNSIKYIYYYHGIELKNFL